MRPRPKGPQFPADDLHAMLIAFGDAASNKASGALPATMSALDAIVTDFVIETCHEAAAHAGGAGRAKVKQDDFQWALRRDARKLGRVQELLEIDKDLKNKRKMVEMDEGVVMRREGREAAAALAAATAASAGEEGANANGDGAAPEKTKRRRTATDARSEKSAGGSKKQRGGQAESVRESIEVRPAPASDDADAEPDAAEPSLDDLFGE